MTYRQLISTMTTVEPRYIEAWMRLEHGTLDALSPSQFHAEVMQATECVKASSRRENESLAKSYGL